MEKLSVNKKFIAVMIFIISLPFTACTASVVKQMPSYAAQSQEQEYRIRPGDQLDVKFFYNPNLNEQVVVRPDGRISLQLAHEIIVAGLTPAKLTDLLTKTYAEHLEKPEITVIVRSFGGQMVFVDGEVNRPGMINVIGPMTVLQSLSQAGGVKDTARRNEIVIIRLGFDNKPVVLLVNREKIIDGTETNQYLMPNDIVYVPRSAIANVNIWVDQYLRKNIPIGIGTGVYYNLGQ